jgi:N-acetyltransferase 10
MTENPTIRPSSSMPPLLQRLSELRPESLDYLGVSYGFTPQLLTYVKVPNVLHWHRLCQAFRFWKRAGFVPLYIRQTASELTGEHTCVMVRGMDSSAERGLEWLGEFAKGSRSWFYSSLYHFIFGSDFRRRFIQLLSYKFREFGSIAALSILEAANAGATNSIGNESRGTTIPSCNDSLRLSSLQTWGLRNLQCISRFSI